MDDPKPRPAKENYEGEEAARRFESFARRLFSVPHEEIKKQEEVWKKERKKRRKAR